MKIPFKNSFDNARTYDKYANYTLYTSTFILIIAFTIQTINKDWSYISDFLNSFNSFFILGYAILEFTIQHIFYEASIQKRYDFIDNSFETSFSEENSTEYFTNDDIDKGIYKMAVNGFENSLFTYNISKRMIKSIWIKNIIIGFLFLGISIAGFNNVFVMLFQLSLPLLLLYQALKLTIFVNRINKVFENYRRLFQDLKNKKKRKSKKPEILINVIEYESTLSWGGIILDKNIYEKLNPKLSEKWYKMKIKYEIK